MALPSATVFELRIAGNNNNGGGFVAGASGTDYSQQDSAQYSAADLVLVTTGTCSSASHSFVAADVGNLIQITAGTGFTAGFYEIVSVAAGVATLDRAAGTASSTGGTWAEGGALGTIGYVMSELYSINVSGITCYIQAGSYAGSYMLTPSVPNRFIGYSATRGDGGRATWTIDSGTALIRFSAFIWFENIAMVNSSGSPGLCFNAQIGDADIYMTLMNCLIDGFSNAFDGYPNYYTMYLENCEIKNCTGDVLYQTYGSLWITLSNCYIHNNSGKGLNLAMTPSVICLGTTFYANSAGIYINTASNAVLTLLIQRSSFVSNTNDGITLQNGAAGFTNLFIQNSIFSGNGGYGIDAGGAYPAIDLQENLNNAFYDNSSGNYTALVISRNEIDLTGSPFTNPSAGNFALNNTAGAGLACQGAAFACSLIG